MKKAFSMIELIFVIAVIGILSAIAVPKLMANRDTAKIVKLKEQIEAVRKGIEAYASSQYIETGSKTYPQTLCSSTSNCTGSSYLFSAVSNVAIAHRDMKKDGVNFVYWNKGAEFMILDNLKKTQGYAFSYSSNNGELKCIDKNANGYSSLPCNNLGELK